MGLDTTHDCWHGAYSLFHQWRQELARLAGYPPLILMEGFYHPRRPECCNVASVCAGKDRENGDFLDWTSQLPIKWDILKPSPLIELLSHSDCEGDIKWEKCAGIANDLAMILAMMDADGGNNWREETQKFITGLRRAYNAAENVEFH